MESPTTGSDLEQFVWAVQCMLHAMPNFLNIVRLLLELIKIDCERAGKRANNANAKLTLSDCGWSAVEEHAFEQCKLAVQHQVALAHRVIRTSLWT